MTADQWERWSERRNYTEPKHNNDDDSIAILPNEEPICEWFFDLINWCEVERNSRTQRKTLKAPSKQEILASRTLLKLKTNKRDYERLMVMIKTAVKEFR